MTTNDSPVLIVGCGDLGIEAGLRFAAAGWPVTGWRRRAERVPAPLIGQSADVTGSLPLPPVDPATGVVVIALTPATRDADGYRATYVDGTRAALAAVEAGGARPRVVFVSSTSVYDAGDGRWLDEDSPAGPASPTAAALREAEELVLARPGGVVLRLAGVYGPGRTRLIDRARRGEPGDPGHWTNRIHRDDAAAAVVVLAGLADPAPVYLGVDDEPALDADVMRFLAGELGVAATSSSPTPGDAVSGNAASGNTVSGNTVSGNTSGKRLSNALLHDTGWAPSYPSYREGYRAVLAGAGVRHP